MKILAFVRIFMATGALACATGAWASSETIESSGLKYSILSEEDRLAAVAGVTGEAPSITVPASVILGNVEYTVTEIADQAFENCSTLQSIQLPNTLTAIRYMAFGHCSALKELAMPPQLTTVENWTFESCTSLEKVEFSPALTFLGYHAFDGCTALEEATLPDSLEEILSHTFNGCTMLKSVRLPKNLKALGESAFMECKSLVYIPLPDSLTELSSTVFSLCSSLTDVTIPASIKSIGIGTFDSCSSLRNLYVLTPTPPTAYKSSFNRLDANKVKVYVPESSLYSFRYTTGWNFFTDFSGIETIENKNFVLEAGSAMQIEATVPAFMSAEWSSSDPAVAEVDGNGLLKAITHGSATLTLTLTDAFGTKTLQEATVTVSGNTSVDDIECGLNDKEDYYSVNGMRLSSSEKAQGICIRVRNGKAERIILR